MYVTEINLKFNLTLSELWFLVFSLSLIYLSFMGHIYIFLFFLIYICN